MHLTFLLCQLLGFLEIILPFENILLVSVYNLLFLGWWQWYSDNLFFLFLFFLLYHLGFLLHLLFLKLLNQLLFLFVFLCLLLLLHFPSLLRHSRLVLFLLIIFQFLIQFYLLVFLTDNLFLFLQL